GRSDIEVLALAVDQAPNGYELVRGSMKANATSPLAFDTAWKAGLNRGIIAGAAPRPFGALTVRPAETGAAFPNNPPARPLGARNLEVTFAPDPKLFDGRHGNNPWLLELPDGMTRITWDNVAILSPATAKALGIKSGDKIEITREGATAIVLPAWI